MLTMTSVSGYFNPRSHEGSDAAVDALDYLKANFNPRSHEGSDSISSVTDPVLIISIHAPTRGATVSVYPVSKSATIFQSTLPRGERPRRIFSKRLRTNYFNPRSHEGSDVSMASAPIP